MVWNICLQHDSLCVHEEKHQHMAVTLEAARVRPFKTKVIVSWLPLATFSRT